MQWRKVLIPLDGSEFSERILPTITKLLDPKTTELVLLRVSPPQKGIGYTPPTSLSAAWPYVDHPPFAHYDRTYDQPVIPAAQVEESIRSSLQNELMIQKLRLQERGYRVSVIVCFGDPDEEIIRLVKTAEVDLVAMATHGRTGLMSLLMGSVAEKVLQHVTVPMLLLRPDTAPIAEEMTTTVEASGSAD